MTTLGTAIQAYANAAIHGRSPVARTETSEEAMPSFGAMLRSELGGTIDALRTSERTSIAGLTGKASVQQVVEAVSAAELSLQKVTAVRDRVISAYQEMMRMPI